MVSIRYPNDPSPVDFSGFERGLAGLGDIVQERRTRKVLDQFADSLYGGQGGGGEMSLASLAPRDQQIARAPLAPVQDPASARVAQAHAVSGDPGTYRSAIKSIESAGSGDYAAVGPAHPQLGRALGAYQVMEANIGPWSKEVFGKEMTPEQFLASPKAQDAIFDRKFGSYVQKFGSPEKAAQAWFAGEGGVGTDRQDSLGTSVPEYSQKFAQALGGGSGASQGVQVAQAGPAAPTQGPAAMGDSLLPPREVMKELFRNRETRPLAAAMAQSAIKARQGDPMAAIELETAKAKLDQLRNPKPEEPKIVELFDEQTGQPYKAQYNAATGQYERVGGIKARSGMSLKTNADGTVELVQGDMRTAPKLTEAEGRNSGFYGRGLKSHELISDLEGEGTSLWNKTAGNLPVVGNYLRTEDAQKYDQAKRDFVNAVLRRESGAVISPQEFANAEEQYFPQPGDGPEVIAQKRANRETTIRGLEVSAGQGATLATQPPSGLSTGNRTSSGIEWSVEP